MLTTVAEVVPMRKAAVPPVTLLPLNWTKVESFCQASFCARPRIHRR